MASPSRRERRRHARTCIHGDTPGCTHLDPELVTARDKAIVALAARLDELGDPIGTALECLSGEQFASLVWHTPAADRTGFLTDLGIPRAKRPTATSARLGLSKLQQWRKPDRDRAARFISGPVASHLDVVWHDAGGDTQQREDAIRVALTSDPGQLDALRLAAVCHGTSSWAMTLALRLAVDTPLAHPDWQRPALDNVITACRGLETVWARIADPRTLARDHEAHHDPDGAEPIDEDVEAPEADPVHEPITEGPAIVSDASAEPAADSGHRQPDNGPASVAANLLDRHMQAQQTAAQLSDALHRGVIPDRQDLAPLTAFLDAADRARAVLAEETLTTGTVDELVAALSAVAGRSGQIARLAQISRLAGPDSERDRIAQAKALAATLIQTPVWGQQQHDHVAGLIALLDLIDAAVAKDMPALSAALSRSEQHLPDSIAGLRLPAIGGQLHLRDNSMDERDAGTTDTAAAPGGDTTKAAAEPVAVTLESAAEPDGAPLSVEAAPGTSATVPDPATTDPDSEHTDTSPPTAAQPVAAAAEPAAAPQPPQPATVGHTPLPAPTPPVLPDPEVDLVTSVAPSSANDPAETGMTAGNAAGRELVRQLLGSGQLSLAHHAAAACGDQRRADALRVFALADEVRSDTSPTAGALRTALDAEHGTPASSDPAVQLLLLAGAVRACLVTADAGAGQSAQASAESLHQLPAVAEVAGLIGTATAKRRLYSPDILAMLAPIAGADNDIAMTVEAARSEINQRRRLDFIPASNMAERFWAPEGVIGRMLAVAADDRASDIETVAETLRLFAKRQYVDTLLDREDAQHRPTGSRPLQGRQRRKLKEMIERSVNVVRAWADAVRANQAAALGTVPADLAKLRQDVLARWPAAEHELQNLITAAADRPWTLNAEAAQACLSSLQRSVAMLNGVKPGGADRDPDVILYQDLLRCLDLAFTADGVAEEPVTIDHVAVAARTSWADAFSQRLVAEDYATAALIIGAVTDPAAARTMHDRLAVAAASSFDELTALHRDVFKDVARATRRGQLDENASTAINSDLAAADLQRLPAPPQSHHLGQIRSRLLDVRDRLPQYLHEAQEALRKRADNEVPAGPKRQELLTKIDARIADGDLATAEEYLLTAVQGEQLPTAEPSEDLTRFLELITQVPDGITRNLINAIRRGEPIPALGDIRLSAAQRDTADTLQMWLDMHDTRHNKIQKSHLMGVLRLAGIEFASMQPLRDLSGSSRRAWWDLTGVRRIGETPGVPQFNPSASEIQRVMLCWGEPDVRAMFGWLGQDPDTDRPVIVLLFAAMTADQRTELAAMCAQRDEKPVIVIDDVAMLHLALHGSGQFLTTTRTLLPFAATNPYAPDAHAALPSEMFFGRRFERADIINPHGANLLYGGRQLGKTALLQEAARAFERVNTNKAIYVTLHNPIGTPVNPLTIWDELAEKLAAESILPPRKTRDPIKNVTTAITAWLDGNQTRRMLLLIDECDGFFDADATLGFEHVTHLRKLRDDTGRRCKPVFAGLHQVQRFAHLPNQPLAGAHLGQQIAIGPLSPEPAYQLLFTPMEALGIRFASDELVHRVLAYCNYQPKLLQLAGKELVSSVLARRRSTAPYYTIDEDLLEQVLGSESLQQRVRQTVRLTLDLDSRYKLIALVVANAALEHGADYTMATTQLRDECQQWWPAGFAGQSPGEFRSLLEEMRDLGVLAVTDNSRWRLRSTNVLRLLGSTNEIWEELCSSHWRTTVTKLSTEQARGHLNDGLISPCTDKQLSRIVNRTSGSVVRVIAGTQATAVDRVRDLLHHSRRGFGARFELSTPSSPQAYGKALRGGEAGGRHHVVLSQLIGARPETVVDTVVKALQIQPTGGVTRTVAVIVDVNTDGVLDLLTGPGFAVGSDDVITLRRATAVGVRSWLSDNELMKAFTETTSQTELMTVTGGWPLLLDRAAGKAREHASTHKVCAHVGAYLHTRDGAAEFLEAVGLRINSDTGDAFQALIDYAGSVTSEELVELCSVTASDPERTTRILQILDVLDQSDVDGKWTPEPVAAAAWRILQRTD